MEDKEKKNDKEMDKLKKRVEKSQIEKKRDKRKLGKLTTKI